MLVTNLATKNKRVQLGEKKLGEALSVGREAQLDNLSQAHSVGRLWVSSGLVGAKPDLNYLRYIPRVRISDCLVRAKPPLISKPCLADCITTQTIHYAQQTTQKQSRLFFKLCLGKKTAGVDGKASLTFEERLNLSNELKRHFNNWIHQLLREIPIPKKDGKTRILKVPTIADLEFGAKKLGQAREFGVEFFHPKSLVSTQQDDSIRATNQPNKPALIFQASPPRAWQCLAKYALEPDSRCNLPRACAMVLEQDVQHTMLRNSYSKI